MFLGKTRELIAGQLNKNIKKILSNNLTNSMNSRIN